MISIIVAMAKGRVIAKEKRMPWYMPADLKHFKAITMGKPVIMGRKTFEGIGKPLPGRRNLVITRQERHFEGVELFYSLEAALKAVEFEPEVMIMGGATVYQQALTIADRKYLTFIDMDVDGDTFFPAWDDSGWSEVSNEAHAPDENNPFTYRFIVLDKLK